MKSAIYFRHIFSIGIILFISSCASTSNVSNTGPSGTTTPTSDLSTSGESGTDISEGTEVKRDGKSFKTAIIANSIPEEYEWIRQNYPGSRVKMQQLIHKDGVPYDVLTVKKKGAGIIKVYFDISKFFGKF